MDRYKELTANTLILTTGTIGSRLVTFLMLPFYTNILSAAEYGTIDLFLQAGSFLVPVCTVGIASAVTRYGLDDRYDKKDVFTTGLACHGLGFAVFLILFAAINLGLSVVQFPSQVSIIQQYAIWILLLVTSSGLHLICGSFVRAEEKMRIYAITGIINTICNVLLMILFLKFLGMSIRGYMLAVIIADVISISFLTVSSKLWRFVSFRELHIPTAKEMIRFSIPLIPATISWWVINMSDRYMIGLFIDASATGIYSVAAKIPSIVTILAGVFMEAWQVSIIGTKMDQARFFSSIMRSYQSLLFLAAGVVTMFSHIIVTLMTSPDYYEAWRYIPMLLLSTVFSCLATYIGSVYTVKKKSVSQLVTTLIGAAVNIVLNLILIPRLGISGATIATFASFLIMFIIRLIDTRKYILIHWSPVRFCFSFILILIQATTLISNLRMVYPVQAACMAGLTAVNFTPLLNGIKKLSHFR